MEFYEEKCAVGQRFNIFQYSRLTGQFVTLVDVSGLENEGREAAKKTAKAGGLKAIGALIIKKVKSCPEG